MVDCVHDVVERRRERVQIFAIEWRDEGLAQTIEKLVDDHIATAFELFHALRHLSHPGISPPQSREKKV